MEIDPRYAEGPESLRQVQVMTPAGERVPLSAFARYEYSNTPLSVSHQGQFAAATISFSLPEGVSLSDATAALNDTMARIGMPASIFGSFEGTARNFQSAMSNQPLLIVGGDPRGLHRARRPLRKLHPSADHPLDAAVGRRRRAAGAAAVRAPSSA